MAKEPFQRFDTCREFAAALSHGDVVWTGSTADTQLATNISPPPRDETYHEQTAPIGSATASPSRTAAMIAIGIAALLAVGVVAFVGARLAQSPSAPPTALPPQPSSTLQDSLPADPPETVTHTATVTPPPTPPSTVTRPPPTPPPQRLPGDLGLPTPISSPPCNGQGIVLLGSVTTPGMYADGIQRLLNAHPGASYLRTDQSCPSLRRADDEGDPIYAVFRLAGTTQREVCGAVRAAGGGAYGKWLDYSTDPGYMIPC